MDAVTTRHAIPPPACAPTLPPAALPYLADADELTPLDATPAVDVGALRDRAEAAERQALTLAGALAQRTSERDAAAEGRDQARALDALSHAEIMAARRLLAVHGGSLPDAVAQMLGRLGAANAERLPAGLLQGVDEALRRAGLPVGDEHGDAEPGPPMVAREGGA